MARRNRRRQTAGGQKRPPSPTPPTKAAVGNGSAPPDVATPAEPADAAPTRAADASGSGSFLPRRQAQTATMAREGAPTEVGESAPAAPGQPSQASGLPPAATDSFLPKKGGGLGKAARRRLEQENLEPLDDTSSAIPEDRVPYLRLDVRKVIFVSCVMVALVILAAFILH
ncbi:MAG: hypothetical protein ACREOL_00485 [Candidatus Dormibacteria bacterium]